MGMTREKNGNDNGWGVRHFGLCATLTRSLRSGPPVGVAFGPRFHGNDNREKNGNDKREKSELDKVIEKT